MKRFTHYSVVIISAVLDVVVTQDDNSEDQPSTYTLKRWHQWLMANKQYFDGALKSVDFINRSWKGAPQIQLIPPRKTPKILKKMT